MNLNVTIALLAFAVNFVPDAAGQTTAPRTYQTTALRESKAPVRPGKPGEVPFWNGYAKRFIYAPAFDYREVRNADSYTYDISSDQTSETFTFTSQVPYAPLSPVWDEVPVGYFNLTVTAMSATDEELGIAGKGRYYRAAPFNGPYHEPPVLSYDESARLALDQMLSKDYVEYWLKHQKPDPDFPLYRYPAKIYSAIVVGAVTHARLEPEDTSRSIKLAITIADFMTSISIPAEHAWAYHPPTYYGPRIGKSRKSHMQLDNYLTIMGADSGNAFLDLYDYTKDKTYLEAAKRIAQSYKKNQLDSGTWYLYANSKTGKPTFPNLAIPTAVINFFDRLTTDYGVKNLEDSSERALAWVMKNPVKTFNWQGQFEDVKATPPYKNQSREQACDLAIYLFKNKRNLKLAEELTRFAEDQFVIWEQARPYQQKRDNPNPGWNSKNWMTPSVQEQYVFWMPVKRSAGIMLETYRQAWLATGKKIYLAKARSIANSITRVQQANHGDYVTMFISTPWNLWLNSTVYPAKYMMQLQETIQKK